MILSAAERERRLAAAWDEPAEAHPLPGCPSLTLRPFSANALRRATAMGLRCAGGGFREALALLPPSRALGEVEALAWLLCAPLDEVRTAMRLQAWAESLAGFELPRAALAPFRDEMDRVLSLLEAAMFETEERPEPPARPGQRPAEEPEPPAHHVRPGMVASLAFALAGKFGRPADELLEWVPACQVFQLAHCLQAGNPRIWTVDPRLAIEAGPHEFAEPEADPGMGEAIAF